MEASKTKKYVLLAIGLPLVTTWIAVQISYSMGVYLHANPTAYIFTAASVIIGIVLLSKIELQNSDNKIIAIIFYVPLIILASFIVAFFAACGNGDCI